VHLAGARLRSYGPRTMKHQYASSGEHGCTCNVKRKSLFGLLHVQSGVHKRGCPKSTKLDEVLRTFE